MIEVWHNVFLQVFIDGAVEFCFEVPAALMISLGARIFESLTFVLKLKIVARMLCFCCQRLFRVIDSSM